VFGNPGTTGGGDGVVKELVTSSMVLPATVKEGDSGGPVVCDRVTRWSAYFGDRAVSPNADGHRVRLPG
jgi:hypothetical protein